MELTVEIVSDDSWAGVIPNLSNAASAAKFIRLELVCFQNSPPVYLQRNLIRFSSEIKDRFMHQIIRNDQSSLVKVSNGTISATYRIFTTAYHNKMIGDPPKHLQVTDLTQFVIDSLCLGYKFLPPSILPTSDSYTFQSSLVDPILEASLTSLLTINISTGSSTSSLLILTPILDGSYASRIKYLSHNLKVPLLYIQAGLILLESARGQCTLAASLKRTLRCCSVLEPCVVLIEDLHLLCPSPGSTRFNSDPATYSETAKVVTQFVQNCYNKKSKQDYATSSSSSFIKIIGICQISNQLGVNYSSVLSMNVSNSFQETVTMPFPDTVTRRHIVHSALNKALRFDISIEDNRALNAWSDKRIGMSSQSLLAYAHLQLQIAHTLSPRKKSTPESISSQKDIRFQNHQNSSQIIGDILGSVSDVYTIKLQSIVDPMAVAVFTNIIDNSTVDKGANLLSSISRIHLQTDNKSQSVNISSDATVSAIKVPKSINFGRIKGHESVKKEITQVVLWPRWFPHIFQTYRVRPATGILLYGPPGTGKSLFPSVLASELGCHLVNIRLNDVIKGSIGSGERALRETFAEAKKSAPSILFIDEFQAIFTSRDAHDGVGSSLAFALNTCFDDVCAWNENAGTESLVTVFAATNEPWAIDSGFLRPGRLERSIFVGPLDHSGRKEYFHSWFHSKLMEYDVSILTQDDTTILTDLLADLTKHFTGADCALLVRKACLICYVECTSSYKGRVGENAGNSIKREGTILLPHLCHFQEALAKMEHSVSKSDIQMYLEWSKKSLK